MLSWVGDGKHPPCNKWHQPSSAVIRTPPPVLHSDLERVPSNPHFWGSMEVPQFYLLSTIKFPQLFSFQTGAGMTSQGLDLVILVVPFWLRIFCDFYSGEYLRITRLEATFKII